MQGLRSSYTLSSSICLPLNKQHLKAGICNQKIPSLSNKITKLIVVDNGREDGFSKDFTVSFIDIVHMMESRG